ncbi:MAG TPA: glycosyltransferase family 2 protein [Moraxellaceae bacterium]|nr:glycosyltransferase family 2 protein [Moraxellaceae bacterium]
MTTATGTVSILIPVYNRAHCIRQTLSSALEQSWRDIEVVVVDNASTDGTWELIQATAAQDSRVRVFRNDSNIGPVRNWLRCVREGTGTYGKILWSDDLLHPEFLAQALPALADPEVGFVFSPALVFSGDSPLEGAPLYRSTPPGVRPVDEFIEGILLGGDYPVSPGCALFRLADMRDCLLEQVPNRVGSDFSMHAIGNDVLLFLLVAARYKRFVRLDAPLAYFREHAGSITISAARGKIPLHYDIAKAWFVSQHPQPAALSARFNALLLLDRILYRGAAYKLRTVADFYPVSGRYSVDVFWLLRRMADRMVHLIRRIVRKI